MPKENFPHAPAERDAPLGDRRTAPEERASARRPGPFRFPEHHVPPFGQADLQEPHHNRRHHHYHDDGEGVPDRGGAVVVSSRVRRLCCRRGRLPRRGGGNPRGRGAWGGRIVRPSGRERSSVVTCVRGKTRRTRLGLMTLGNKENMEEGGRRHVGGPAPPRRVNAWIGAARGGSGWAGGEIELAPVMRRTRKRLGRSGGCRADKRISMRMMLGTTYSPGPSERLCLACSWSVPEPRIVIDLDGLYFWKTKDLARPSL